MKDRILAFCRHRKWYFAAFFLPALLLFFSFALVGTAPFGERSVLVLDLAGQYVWYLEALRDAILGEGGLIYSLSRSLGGEMLGILAYYLASPFSLLVLCFPREEIQIAIFLILLLKTGACGITMYAYLERKAPDVRACLRLALSVAYALSGFAVAYQSNLMWTDALILLPVVVMGMERLLTDGHRRLFTLSLALLILTNYYIGFMVCLFCVLWFAGHVLIHREEHRGKFRQYLFNKTSDFAVSSVFAGLFAAPMWAPGLYALTLGKLSSTSSSLSSPFSFSLADAIPKLLPGTYDTLMEDGLPFLYCGILVLLLLPLYFCSEHYTVRERAVRGAGLLLLFLSMWIKPLDLVWHGLRAPNCLNFRYAFLLVFLMILTAAEGLQAPPRKAREPVLVLLAGVLLLALAVFAFSDRIAEPLPFLLITLISCVLSALLLCLFLQGTGGKQRQHRTKKGAKKGQLQQKAGRENRIRAPLLAGALCVLLCLELGANAVLTLRAMDADVGFARYGSFRENLTDLLAAKEQLSSIDSSLYRAELTGHTHSNENMGAGLYGISGSTSTLHASSLALLSALGYPAVSHWSSYVAPNPFADALLGIRYCITQDPMPARYTEIAEQIFCNEQALSLCYRIAGTDCQFGVNAAKNCNALARALTGAEHGDVYCAIGGEEHYYIGGTLYAAEQDSLVLLRESAAEPAAMVFAVTASETGDVWFLLPSAAATSVILTCNERIEPMFDRAKGYFVYLGSFSAGETIRVQLTLDSETEALTFYRDEPHFYTLSEEACSAYLSLLAASQAELHTVSSSHFEGTLTAQEADEIYLLSLPYDPCLRVYIDGRRAETLEALGGLTGFRVTSPGTHTVTVRYVPLSLFAGLLLCGLAIPAWILLFDDNSRRKRRKAQCSIL